MLLLLLIYEILVDLALPIAALPGNEAARLFCGPQQQKPLSLYSVAASTQPPVGWSLGQSVKPTRSMYLAFSI